MAEQPARGRRRQKDPLRPFYNKTHARSLQSLALYAQDESGTVPAPSNHDVKTALTWIVEEACGTYRDTYADSDGNTTLLAHLTGRRSVGLAIVSLMKFRPEVLDRDSEEP